MTFLNVGVSYHGCCQRNERCSWHWVQSNYHQTTAHQAKPCHIEMMSKDPSIQYIVSSGFQVFPSLCMYCWQINLKKMPLARWPGKNSRGHCDQVSIAHAYQGFLYLSSCMDMLIAQGAQQFCVWYPFVVNNIICNLGLGRGCSEV